MRPILLAIATVSILSVFLASCDLFQTRDPEEPSQSSSKFTPPGSPEIVLENFETAVEDANVDNYMRCITDSSTSGRMFTFLASADFQGFFGSWNRSDERQYFLRLGKPSAAFPALTLTPTQAADRAADSVIYYLEYTLFFPHGKPGVSQFARGNMQLFVGKDFRGEWSIYRWIDFRTLTDSTWSYLKASI